MLALVLSHQMLRLPLVYVVGLPIFKKHLSRLQNPESIGSGRHARYPRTLAHSPPKRKLCFNFSTYADLQLHLTA